jgi:hypothetical protein
MGDRHGCNYLAGLHVIFPRHHADGSRASDDESCLDYLKFLAGSDEFGIEGLVGG